MRRMINWLLGMQNYNTLGDTRKNKNDSSSDFQGSDLSAQFMRRPGFQSRYRRDSEQSPSNKDMLKRRDYHTTNRKHNNLRDSYMDEE